MGARGGVVCTGPTPRQLVAGSSTSSRSSGTGGSRCNSFYSILVLEAGLTLPTGPAKPARSGTGIPVQFSRKPVGTGEIQI